MHKVDDLHPEKQLTGNFRAIIYCETQHSVGFENAIFDFSFIDTKVNLDDPIKLGNEERSSLTHIPMISEAKVLFQAKWYQLNLFDVCVTIHEIHLLNRDGGHQNCLAIGVLNFTLKDTHKTERDREESLPFSINLLSSPSSTSSSLKRKNSIGSLGCGCLGMFILIALVFMTTSLSLNSFIFIYLSFEWLFVGILVFISPFLIAWIVSIFLSVELDGQRQELRKFYTLQRIALLILQILIAYQILQSLAQSICLSYPVIWLIIAGLPVVLLGVFKERGLYPIIPITAWILLYIMIYSGDMLCVDQTVAERIDLERYSYSPSTRPRNIDLQNAVLLGDQCGIRVPISSQLLFQIDQSSVSYSAASYLRQLLILLNQVELRSPHAKVILEGHTDYTGSDLHNQILSERRAKAIADWITEHSHIQLAIDTVGYGSSQPAFQPFDDPKLLKFNRRVEVLIDCVEPALEGIK